MGVAVKHAIDPVCESDVLVWWSGFRGLQSEVAGKRYYFCSSGCKRNFDLHPSAYTMLEDLSRASDDGMTQPGDVVGEQ